MSILFCCRELLFVNKLINGPDIHNFSIEKRPGVEERLKHSLLVLVGKQPRIAEERLSVEILLQLQSESRFTIRLYWKHCQRSNDTGGGGFSCCWCKRGKAGGGGRLVFAHSQAQGDMDGGWTGLDWHGMADWQSNNPRVRQGRTKVSVITRMPATTTTTSAPADFARSPPPPPPIQKYIDLVKVCNCCPIVRNRNTMHCCNSSKCRAKKKKTNKSVVERRVQIANPIV